MMARHATRSRRLKTAEMVHARSTPPPSAQLDSNGRAPNTPVGTGAGHRRSENWLAVPFSVPSDSHPFIPRAIVADISGLENRYGLSVHRGFESPPLRLETADSLLWQGTRSFFDRSGQQSSLTARRAQPAGPPPTQPTTTPNYQRKCEKSTIPT